MTVDTHPVYRERNLYTWAALAALAVVFGGFAKSYFLKLNFDTPALPALLHVHGLVMTLWFGFFLLQVRLVAMRRTDLHRRAGVLGAFIAAAVLIVGVTTALTAAKLGHTPGPPPLVFLAVPLFDMAVFAVLVGTALALRRRPDVHKRLMLLSCIGMVTAAVSRIPLDALQAGGLLAFFGVTDALVLACVAYDTLKNRRLHPAFGWGALFVMLSHPARFMIAGTAQWQQFATWLVSLI